MYRWYISGVQIHEDLVVTHFDAHIRGLTASFDTKLADVRNPDWLKRKPRAAGVVKPVEVTAGWLSRLNESCSSLIS